jgi:hypothetical protein
MCQYQDKNFQIISTQTTENSNLAMQQTESWEKIKILFLLDGAVAVDLAVAAVAAVRKTLT